MESTKNIKIYISCHKEAYVPHNKLFFPIQVGVALNHDRLPNSLSDATGDNISEKNRSYCELTAQYWAWKNEEADYYGFFHYRRYFSFSENVYPTNDFGEVIENYNDDETLKKYGIIDDKMIDIISKYDLIIPTEGGFGNTNLSIYEQYSIATQHIKSDLDTVIDIIKLYYPNMYNYAKEYLDKKQGYFCNMFIMKKELFNEYNSWLFDILEKHEKKVDISNYGVQQYRVHGYLAERLCGIYLYYILKTRNYKVLKLQRVLFKNTDILKETKPAFEANNIPVIFSANNFYVPYLSALMESIKRHSNDAYNYDLLVLTSDIDENNRKLLKRQIEQNNISLRFMDVGRIMAQYKNLPLRGHFRVETYFRLLLPEILCLYNKVLYLDSDMIVCDDVAKLYQENIDGFLFAATLDADSAGLYNGYEPNKKNYIDNILKLKKPYDYIQAGTIIFNLNEFRKKYTIEGMMTFAGSYNWELLDQDVLNYLGQGNIKFIDMAWNVMMDWNKIRIRDIISLAPQYLYDQYMNARKNPKIIHYAGPDKPWDFPESDFASYFWQYSRMTPFYEQILYRNKDASLSHIHQILFNINEAIQKKMILLNNNEAHKDTAVIVNDNISPKKTPLWRKMYNKKFVRIIVDKIYPKDSKRRKRLKNKLLKNN